MSSLNLKLGKTKYRLPSGKCDFKCTVSSETSPCYFGDKIPLPKYMTSVP